jgi:hypothetical protein
VANQEIHVDQYRYLQHKYREVTPPDLTSRATEFHQTGSNLRQKDLNTGLESFDKTLSDGDRAHLLKRTLFGVSKKELRAFSGQSLAEMLDTLLTKSAAPPLPINNYNFLSDKGPDPDIPHGKPFIEAPFNNTFEGWRVISLKSWQISQMLKHKTSLEEKMILFWWNMLPIQLWGVFVTKATYGYISLLRRNVFGNFKQIIKELTVDPAMLIYLSGAFNSKEAPDENYARELQELFCIGKGSNAKFTEKDVQSAAKVLTGWTIQEGWFGNTGPAGSRFVFGRHDTSDKEFSSFYGNKVIKGRFGLDGAKELDELLDMIFSNNEVALHLSRKLYQFFVSTEISTQTEQLVIEPLAKIIRSNNYDVLPALRALFGSAHFFDEQIQGSQIKTPVDHLLALWKSFDMPRVSDPQQEIYLYSALLWRMSTLGMEIGDPPNVAGWPAFYQKPLFDKTWITTDTITERALITDSMIYWGYWINKDYQIVADILAHFKNYNNPGDPNSLIEEFSSLHLGIKLAETQIQTVKSILLSGQTSDYYWTGAWDEFISKPNDEAVKEIVLNRLKPALQTMLQLGEAQLM